MELEDKTILTTDADKFHALFKVMGCTHLDDDKFENLVIKRCGAVRTGYNRVLKVSFENKHDRDEFTKCAKALKEAPQLWKTIYVKKDQHPTYVAENARLRKKMVNLKKAPENENKQVLIKNGKLMINEVMVDQNLFFH